MYRRDKSTVLATLSRSKIRVPEASRDLRQDYPQPGRLDTTPRNDVCGLGCRPERCCTRSRRCTPTVEASPEEAGFSKEMSEGR
jgi:hypothetical protein